MSSSPLPHKSNMIETACAFRPEAFRGNMTQAKEKSQANDHKVSILAAGTTDNRYTSFTATTSSN
jgi:hypothetical protein